MRKTLDAGNYKSISEIPDRELLEAILAAQLATMRYLHIVEVKLAGLSPEGSQKSIESPYETARDFIRKTEAYYARMDDVLKKQDE